MGTESDKKVIFNVLKQKTNDINKKYYKVYARKAEEIAFNFLMIIPEEKLETFDTFIKEEAEAAAKTNPLIGSPAGKMFGFEESMLEATYIVELLSQDSTTFVLQASIDKKES